MGKIETVFGGLLIVFVVAAASYALIGTWLAPSSGSAPSQAAAALPDAGADSPVAVKDLCGCYRRAVTVAAQENLDVASPLYKAGFTACRERFGSEGGDYWTAGWRARSEDPRRPKSCRAWQSGR